MSILAKTDTRSNDLPPDPLPDLLRRAAALPGRKGVSDWLLAMAEGESATDQPARPAPERGRS